MPSFSPPDDQHSVFLNPSEFGSALPQWQIGAHWVNLYAVLGVAETAGVAEIENAVLEQGSRYLGLAFSRGGQSELAVLIQRFLHDFRPVLLDRENRRRYDELLARHRRGEPELMTYQEFRASLSPENASRRAGCLNAVLLLALALALWAGGATTAVLIQVAIRPHIISGP